MRVVVVLLATCLLSASSKKKKSEYTQADWDRIAREWEREEIEEEERERKEAMNKGPGIQFDPEGPINPEQLLAQSKRGKPTMVFFNVREEYAPTQKELTTLTTTWASLLLNAHVQVQNFPVSERRAIFMVQDGSLSIQVKDFLLSQKEVESVNIDQQTWDADGDGVPTYPGQKKVEKKKKTEKKVTKSKDMEKKTEFDNMSEEDMKQDITQARSKDDDVRSNSIDEKSDEDLKKKVESDMNSKAVKSVKPRSESEDNNIQDLKLQLGSDNDVKTEL